MTADEDIASARQSVKPQDKWSSSGAQSLTELFLSPWRVFSWPPFACLSAKWMLSLFPSTWQIPALENNEKGDYSGQSWPGDSAEREAAWWGHRGKQIQDPCVWRRAAYPAKSSYHGTPVSPTASSWAHLLVSQCTKGQLHWGSRSEEPVCWLSPRHRKGALASAFVTF